MHPRRRAVGQLNPYGQISKKWGPHIPDPFSAELANKTIQPLPQVMQKEMKDFEASWLGNSLGVANPRSVSSRAAQGKHALGYLAKKQLKTAIKQQQMQINDQFAQDFQMWLLGKDPTDPKHPAFIKDRLKAMGVKPDHGPIPDPMIHRYMDQFVDRKSDFMKRYTLIRGGPNKFFKWDINHYYLYYKYVLRGIPYAEDLMLADFDKYFPESHAGAREPMPMRPTGWKDSLLERPPPAPQPAADGSSSSSSSDPSSSSILPDIVMGGDEPSSQVQGPEGASYDILYGARESIYDLTWGKQPYLCSENLDIVDMYESAAFSKLPPVLADLGMEAKNVYSADDVAKIEEEYRKAAADRAAAQQAYRQGQIELDKAHAQLRADKAKLAEAEAHMNAKSAADRAALQQAYQQGQPELDKAYAQFRTDMAKQTEAASHINAKAQMLADAQPAPLQANSDPIKDEPMSTDPVKMDESEEMEVERVKEEQAKADAAFIESANALKLKLEMSKREYRSLKSRIIDDAKTEAKVESTFNQAQAKRAAVVVMNRLKSTLRSIHGKFYLEMKSADQMGLVLNFDERRTALIDNYYSEVGSAYDEAFVQLKSEGSLTDASVITAVNSLKENLKLVNAQYVAELAPLYQRFNGLYQAKLQEVEKNFSDGFGRDKYFNDDERNAMLFKQKHIAIADLWNQEMFPAIQLAQAKQSMEYNDVIQRTFQALSNADERTRQKLGPVMAALAQGHAQIMHAGEETSASIFSNITKHIEGLKAFAGSRTKSPSKRTVSEAEFQDRDNKMVGITPEITVNSVEYERGVILAMGERLKQFNNDAHFLQNELNENTLPDDDKLLVHKLVILRDMCKIDTLSGKSLKDRLSGAITDLNRKIEGGQMGHVGVKKATYAKLSEIGQKFAVEASMEKAQTLSKVTTTLASAQVHASRAETLAKQSDEITARMDAEQSHKKTKSST